MTDLVDKWCSLEETADFVYKKDLKVRLNNAGSEHKLN